MIGAGLPPRPYAVGVTAIGPAEPISQEDLEHYVFLRNKARKFAEKRDRMAQELLERVLAGALVEDGAHETEIIERSASGRIEKRLVVR